MSFQHRVTTFVVAGLTALLFAPVAVADDDWVAKWSNGHKIENSDKGHKLKFGGRIMADYQFAGSNDFGYEDGFEFRRARFVFSGTVYDRVEFKAEYDFAGGDADFTDVYLALKQDWGKIKFGHFREEISLENLTSSKNITFLERSLPIGAFAPGRNSGIGFEGNTGDKFNWAVGYFYDADNFGTSISEDDTNLTGRISFRPYYEDGDFFHIGLGASFKDRASSIRFRTRPENHIGARTVDTGTFSADSAEIFNAELATVMGPFWAMAEVYQVDVDSPANGDPSFDGAYVQAGWFLTGERRAFKTSVAVFDRIKPKTNFGQGSGAWELKFRYSTVNLNDGAIFGGEQDNVSVGVNWYLNPVTRLMIDYVDADVDNVGDAQFFLVRWSFDF